jgi:hypothetical protein
VKVLFQVIEVRQIQAGQIFHPLEPLVPLACIAGIVDWYRVRNRWCLTNVRKCLILLAFVSYEAVRLWWWDGNCGVVDFEKIL